MGGDRLRRRAVLRAAALGAGALTAGQALACSGGSRRVAKPVAPAPSASVSLPPQVATAGPSAGAEAVGKAGGTLALAAAGYPSGFDPVAVNAGLTDAFASLVYNGLLSFRNGTAAFPDPGDGSVAPDLAATLPEQPDERTYVFRLRQDVRWQQAAPLNGRPFTAEDVTAHYRRATSNPRSVLRPTLAVIDSMDAPDATTVRLLLKAPHAPLLSTIAGGFERFILPRELAESARPGGRPAGTGPFVLDSTEANRSATFKRNPTYFKKSAAGAALPYAAQLNWLVVPDAGARLQAYQSRQANLTWPLTPDEVAQLQSSNPNDYVFGEGTGVANAIVMRLDRPPFDDVRVRQALALALDRADLLKQVAAGHGEIDLPIPVFLSGLSPQLAGLGSAARYYSRDVQAALQLLSAAGYADGAQATFSFTGQYGDAFLQAARLVEGYLGEAGFHLTPRQLDYPTYVGTVFRGEFDGLAYAPRNVFPDPDAYLSDVYLPGGRFNQGHTGDQHLLDLITRQRQTLDAQARAALLTELQRYLSEQQCVVPDVALSRGFAWQKALQNYRGTVWPSYAQLETAWLST